MRKTTIRALVFVLSALAGSVATGPASAGELLVTGAKPDRLYVIDADKRAVLSEFRVPGANGLVGAIVPSPDGRIAYVLVNKMESISGIDLKSGKEVFRADLSTPGERVKIEVQSLTNLPGVATMSMDFHLRSDGNATVLRAVLDYTMKNPLFDLMNVLMMKKMNASVIEGVVAGHKKYLETGVQVVADTPLELDKVIVVA